MHEKCKNKKFHVLIPNLNSSFWKSYIYIHITFDKSFWFLLTLFWKALQKVWDCFFAREFEIGTRYNKIHTWTNIQKWNYDRHSNQKISNTIIDELPFFQCYIFRGLSIDQLSILTHFHVRNWQHRLIGATLIGNFFDDPFLN